MKRIGASGLVLGLVTLAAVSQAAGQVPSKADVESRGYFGFGGGLSIPVGDYGDFTKTGWVLQGFGGVTFRDGLIGVRADGMFGQNKDKGADQHMRLIGANVDLVVTPGRRPMNVHPYLLGGVGFYNAKLVGTPGAPGSSKFALNAGVGIQVHTGHAMDLYVESRIITVRTAIRTNFVPLTVGLRFGGI